MKAVIDEQVMAGFVRQFLWEHYEDPEPIPAFHMDWWRYFTSSQKNVMIAAPRSHAKSTSLNHAYGLAIALFQQHPFQFKVSRTYELAVEKLQQAKMTLVDNEKIKHIFGFKNFLKDTENDFVAEFNDGYQMRMFALGMEQKVRGKSWGTVRPTAIICDDMEDDEQVMSRERRDKSMKWFMRVLMPVGGRNTINRVCGTILHEDSILMRLKKMQDWDCHVYQACDELVSQESVLWPEMFPRQRLLTIKQSYIDAGDVAGWNQEYRNDTVDLTSGYFRPEDFRPMPEDFDKEDMDGWTFYVGMDFAISTKDRADYTCLVVAGLADDGFLHLVDVRRGRWDGNQIIDEMLSVEQTFAPAEWFVESGAIQKALGPAMELKMREADEGKGRYMNLHPIVPTKDKESRGRSLQARMRAKAVKFDRDASWFADLEHEFLQFPRGKNDDMVDATAYIGLGLARMATPMTHEEEEDMERETAIRESMSLGRSSVTGY